MPDAQELTYMVQQRIRMKLSAFHKDIPGILFVDDEVEFKRALLILSSVGVTVAYDGQETPGAFVFVRERPSGHMKVSYVTNQGTNSSQWA